jgi:uncharacterized protein (TIGR03382 family)
MSSMRSLFVVTALLVGRSADADVTRCASGEADLHYQNMLFNTMSGDTGWFPQGYAAQLKLTARVAGQTTVALGLQPTACWDGPMSVKVPGRANAGLLDFAYGAELHLYAQIHTSILGQQIDWMGEIPLATDYLLGKTTTFSSSVLPGGEVVSVAGSDTTSPLKLIGTNLIGNYIGIPGISGGLHLDAIGTMTTTYRTTKVTVAGTAIESATGDAMVATPQGGFASNLELPMSAAGALRYAPGLRFNVGFNVKILGFTVVDFTLASVTVPLPNIDQTIELAGDGGKVPLPKATSLEGARVDFSAGARQTLTIKNTGTAPLMLEPTALPPGVTAQALTVAPQADAQFVVEATSSAIASGTADLVVATNDPSQPSVTVMLGRNIGGTGVPGDEDESGESSGCNAAHDTSGLLLLLALATLRRRRR